MATKDILLTGDRPTGPLHIGHYAGSLAKRVALQGTYDPSYIMIADTQALTDHAQESALLKERIMMVMKDYLSVGLDPNQYTIFLQSLVPELHEFTSIYMNFVTFARLRRNPTVKTEMQSKNYGDQVPVGFLVYPISQCSDITAFSATVVPTGDDQQPMIEQSNEIVRAVNNYCQKDVLVESKVLLSEVTRLPGTDGGQKMGKSLGNCIYLTDSKEDVDAKVMSMFTDPNHLKVSDPGKVEGNAVFAYLNAFDPDREGLAEMEDHYRRGGLGDVTCKRRLQKVLQDVLGPIRDRHAQYADKDEELWEILFESSKRARRVAQAKLLELKEAMGLSYE